MKKYRSEIAEILHGEFLADFEVGAITEAELREFEADAFVECANEVGNDEDDDSNEAAEALVPLSQTKEK